MRNAYSISSLSHGSHFFIQNSTVLSRKDPSAASHSHYNSSRKMSGTGLTENSFRNMEQSYQAILGPEVRQEANEVHKAKRVLGFSALIFLVFTFGIFVLAGSAQKGATLKASSEAFLAGKCAPCTFIQCKADLCDAIQDPFQCTKGAAVNGCSVKEETWSLSGVCEECCSAADCAETIAGGDNDDKVAPCGDCTEDQCATLALVSSQMCYKSAPYVCVEGSSRMGCSADPYHWPAMAETQCSECCNQLACA